MITKDSVQRLDRDDRHHGDRRAHPPGRARRQRPGDRADGRRKCDKFVFPAGAKLTDAQYEASKNGGLSLNVHSAAHPGGEIRAQIK